MGTRRCAVAGALVVLALIAGCTESAPTQPTSATVAPDVGTADFVFLPATAGEGSAAAAVLRGPDFLVVVDTGHPTSSERHVDHVADLEELGVESIDLLVATHPHDNHTGQHPEILDTFDVGEVWMPGYAPEPARDSDHHHDAVMDAIRSSAARYREPRARETHRFGSLTVEVLHPAAIRGPYRTHDAVNRDSLVLRATFGGVAVLLTGDALHASEAEMMARSDVAADVLELGHHGVRDATSPEWVEAVSPQVAVSSVDRPGLPDDEVLDALRGIPVYGTDLHGTVIVETDGRELTVHTERDRPPR